jgi:hypothetical protein
MALLLFGRKPTMEVSRFELDAKPAADQRQEPRRDEARTTMRAASETDEGDQRRDEPLEEPGYGHGV